MNLSKLANLSQVVACFGILPAMWGIFDSSRQAQIEEQKTQALLRLTAFPALDSVIQRDRDERRNVETAVTALRAIPDGAALDEHFGTGRSAYYGIAGLAEAGRHYEYLGTMIRLEYIEFEPIFEVISFPDDLWEEMERTGLLDAIRSDNWGAPGKPLPDFWSNSAYLRECYQAARQGKPLPGEAEPAPEAFRFDDLLLRITGRES